jgi:hypothetical protein
MRSLPLLIVFLAISCPSCGQPEASDPGPPAADSRAQIDRDDASWADLEAQRRATDGDYDGAVQAHQEAEQKLQEAQRQQTREQTGHP